ncbi:MAG: GNAT family N-acetyltransferase [Chthoniobacteraceae bacterium]
MSAVGVRTVSAQDVIAVRWLILRAGFPRESAVFDGDDAPATIHLGGFVEDRLVGVASIYAAPMPDQPGDARQLRGMATLPAVRGAGVGRALLAACEDAARASGAALIWCNARVSAAEFYRRLGWEISGAEFDIPTVGPHFRMSRSLV